MACGESEYRVCHTNARDEYFQNVWLTTPDKIDKFQTDQKCSTALSLPRKTFLLCRVGVGVNGCGAHSTQWNDDVSITWSPTSESGTEAEEVNNQVVAPK